MTNNEILKIEKKNPNKPNEPPVVLGIFPSAHNTRNLTSDIINAVVCGEFDSVDTEDLRMEQNLIEEFDRLKAHSNMIACFETRTAQNKRCMVVYLVEK